MEIKEMSIKEIIEKVDHTILKQDSTWDQVRAIAEDKMPDLNCLTVEAAMPLVAGTARSMGITVKGEFPGK